MKKLFPSTQFKKDLKKYKNKPEYLAELQKVLDMLANEEEIPKELKPHNLDGNYDKCQECHIKSDFLLIWMNNDIINLVRLGSHSELFGRNKK